MTRSDPNPNLVEFDPELERTLRQIRKAKRRLFETSFANNSSVDSFPELATNDSDFAGSMANRTLKELAAPDVNY